MRKLAVGAAFAATTACLSVAISGVAGSTSPIGGGLFKLPPAAADDLPAFEDCDALLDWYVEKALPQVGPWGFGYPYYWALEGDGIMLSDVRFAGLGTAAMPAAMNAVASRDAAEATGSSDTGTNVQEAGIDEPDRAKTDGRLVFRIHERHLVVTDVSGDEPVELSRTPMPPKFEAQNLLLIGDTVLVTASSYDYAPMGRIAIDSYYGGGVSSARIAAYDVSAPRNPVLVSEHSYEGTLVEARQYGETVRLVLQHSGLPQLDFVQPNNRRTEREATRENRDILRNSTIEDWLPLADHDGVEAPLVRCEDVRHPLTDSGLGTISVVTFQADDPANDSAVAVTTSGSVAYSATDRLYVATPVMPEVPADPWGLRDWIRPAPEGPARTEIHAFALSAEGTTYVASGTVQGMVKDRWSFDDHGGELRVATGLTKNWETTDNAVTVLRQDGGELRVLGSVRGLGPREEIKSVRWFDDFAVVVTFRQIDPLYTVDLTDPTDPKVLGELKIPGFSAYLHPIGDDQLLGLGTSATMEGQVQGSQIATFDISDLRDPKQLDVLRMRDVDELTAAWDPHAFNFIGGHAFTIANTWDRDSNTRIIKLAIGADGGLTELTSYPSSYDARILPIEGGRVALVGDAVRIVAD